MVGQSTITGIIDAAFFALVLYTCYRSLFRSTLPDTSVARARRWKEELQNVEESLRELIGEASAAGSNLNRSLLKRKDELQTLIRRIEEARLAGEEIIEEQETAPIPARRISQYAAHELAQAPAAQARPSHAETRRKPAPQPPAPAASPDLPNASWTRAPRAQGYAMQDNDEGDAFELGLDSLLDSAADRVTITQASAPMARRIAAPAPGMDRSKALAAQIEKLKMKSLDAEEEELPPPPPGVDAIAFKVARRLLSAGKEIHVVARKLELPIAEVRMIERMMRIEQGEEIDVMEGDETELAQERIAESAPKRRATAKFDRSSSLL